MKQFITVIFLITFLTVFSSYPFNGNIKGEFGNGNYRLIYGVALAEDLSDIDTYSFEDSDSDGVIDQLDACINTPKGSVVYSDGCPALKGDFNDNKKLGLEDVIGILQTISGLRYVTVSGAVFDISGTPLNGAQVTINSGHVTVFTDSNGFFSTKIKAGDYDIAIKMGSKIIYTSFFICDGNASYNFGDIKGEYCDFTGWRKHLSNPLFSSGGTGKWDNPLRGITILKDPDESIYKMWYVGGTTTYDEGMSIGYATSTDGINWVPYSNNPVMTHGNAWDINGFSGINVIKDGSVYKLWYEGIDNNGVNRIGYATSTDGINWVPYSNNPVFSPGVSGSWDDNDVGDPWVIKEDLTYKMWYFGDNDLTDIDQIGLATSSDGINWQRTGTDGLVMSPDSNVTWENGEGVGTPKVIKNASGYTMAYHAADQSGTVRVGIATSIDGLTWDKEIDPILDVGDGNAWDSVSVVTGALIDDSICLKLWYLGIDADIDPPDIKVGLAVTCK